MHFLAKNGIGKSSMTCSLNSILVFQHDGQTHLDIVSRHLRRDIDQSATKE